MIPTTGNPAVINQTVLRYLRPPKVLCENLAAS